MDQSSNKHHHLTLLEAQQNKTDEVHRKLNIFHKTSEKLKGAEYLNFCKEMASNTFEENFSYNVNDIINLSKLHILYGFIMMLFIKLLFRRYIFFYIRCR